jgi:3-oxosteroid 1-dehydrogenase
MSRDERESFDVIVLGTGAAGLTAALSAHGHGASVLVLEKDDRVGGTAAWSGGMIWIPCNSRMAAIGVDDSPDEALGYLASLSHGTIEPHLAAAYVREGAGAVDWLEANTPAEFVIVQDFPDYHPEHPGGKPGGGRSLECPLFSFHELGEWAPLVTVGPQMAPNRTMDESGLGHGHEPSPDELARRVANDERGCGQALVGRLLKGCLDRGIEIRRGVRVEGLRVEGGAVRGVDLAAGFVAARGGVVLATGGFEKDPKLVASFLRGPLQRSVSVPTNTGDGLKMAMRAGASLGNMREAWWTPTIDVGDQSTPTTWMINRERTRPGTMMVNSRGRRFANEAANYNAFGAAFHQLDATTFDYSNLPAWLVFDHAYLTRWGLAHYRGEGELPWWLHRADTIAELADVAGIDPDGLVDTVETFNGYAADGRDPEFARGQSRHDTWWGDHSQFGSGEAGDQVGDARATLGALATGPFYATRVYPGALGTKGGPRTTGEAQVLDLDEVPIPGLYAAGNVMSSMMGMTYGGAGGTLGPGLVFGFLAGRAAARAAVTATAANEARSR